jgi:hypothetical protein
MSYWKMAPEEGFTLSSMSAWLIPNAFGTLPAELPGNNLIL